MMYALKDAPSEIRNLLARTMAIDKPNLIRCIDFEASSNRCAKCLLQIR